MWLIYKFCYLIHVKYKMQPTIFCWHYLGMSHPNYIHTDYCWRVINRQDKNIPHKTILW